MARAIVPCRKTVTFVHNLNPCSQPYLNRCANPTYKYGREQQTQVCLSSSPSHSHTFIYSLCQTVIGTPKLIVNIGRASLMRPTRNVKGLVRGLLTQGVNALTRKLPDPCLFLATPFCSLPCVRPDPTLSRRQGYRHEHRGEGCDRWR